MAQQRIPPQTIMQRSTQFYSKANVAKSHGRSALGQSIEMLMGDSDDRAERQWENEGGAVSGMR